MSAQQNERGQGVSHAQDSALPQKVQEKVSVDISLSMSPDWLWRGSIICWAQGPRCTSRHKLQQADRQGLSRHWRFKGTTILARRSTWEGRESRAKRYSWYQGCCLQRRQCWKVDIDQVQGPCIVRMHYDYPIKHIHFVILYFICIYYFITWFSIINVKRRITSFLTIAFPSAHIVK